MKSPPVDLLVWFAPRKDCELKVIDRLIDDPRADACPNQVRYQWEGTPAIWEQLVFKQVYYPHSPYRARAISNNPNPSARAAYANELQATAHASGIQIIQDSFDATVLRLELTPGEIEWIVFNQTGTAIEFAGQNTTDPLLYSRNSSN